MTELERSISKVLEEHRHESGLLFWVVANQGGRKRRVKPTFGLQVLKDFAASPDHHPT